MIIVYGSQAPGGAAHTPFADLPGRWLQGKIKVEAFALPDDVGIGYDVEIPAWLLVFEDVAYIPYGEPGQHEQSLMLYDRWDALDKSVGPDFLRGEFSWQPDAPDAENGIKGMQRGNVYFPRARVPQWANQTRRPHPDKAGDLHALWREVVQDGVNYENDTFIALIKDAAPTDYDALFGALPNGAAFTARLKAMFADLALTETSMLWDGTSESYFFYGAPTTRNAVPPEVLLDLAKAAIAAKAAVLPAESAQHLQGLTYQLGSEESVPDPYDSDAFEAEEEADDIIREFAPWGAPWNTCLREACYGVAGSYDMVNALMASFQDQPYDPEPAYAFWRAGGRYGFVGQTCFVWSVPLRKTAYGAPPAPPPKTGWRSWFGS